MRLYTMFIGPPEKDAEWNDQGIEGAARFLRRLWSRVRANREIIRDAGELPIQVDQMEKKERDLYRKTHETIRHVTSDMDGAFHFNSAIAQVMELMNAIDACSVDENSSESHRAVYAEAIEAVILLLSPFAPHISEELWVELGHEAGILDVSWPKPNEQALERDELEIVVQVNGKVRSHVSVPSEIDRKELEDLALSLEDIKYVEGKEVKKVIVVPGKLVNIAVKG